MKKLKVGDLVYHKEYGQGLINAVNEPNISVRSENTIGSRYELRKDLFVKGDEVRFKKTNRSFLSSWETTTYLGYAPHCKKHKYVVKHYVDGGHRIIHSYTYVFDIEHIGFDIEHIEDVQPWDEFRKEAEGYARFCKRLEENERVEQENKKKQMLKDIKILELEATIRKMFEAIEELKNEN